MMQIRRRLGDVLVEPGCSPPQQLEQALEAQRKDTGRPPAARPGASSTSGWPPSARSPRRSPTCCGLELIDLSRMRPRAGRRPAAAPRRSRERTRVLVLDRSAERPGRGRRPTRPNVVALDDVKLYTGTPELHVLVATESQIRDQIDPRLVASQHDARDVSADLRGAVDDDDDGAVDADIAAAPRTRRSSGSSTRSSPTPCTLRRQRHPHRAAARRPAHPLPRRRRAPRRHDGAAQRDRDVRRQPDQDRVGPGHRRAAPPAGRPHPVRRRTAQHVDARVSRPCPRCTARRSSIRLLAPARRGCRRSTGSASTPRQLAAVPLGAAAAPQGLVLITGPTGSRQDEHAVLRDRRRSATPTATSSRSRTRSRSSCPGITQVQVNERDGHDVRRGLRVDPAPGPRRRPGRRGPRHRDRRAGAAGVADRPPRAHDAAHERAPSRRSPGWSTWASSRSSSRRR